ncbi:hypothetical protein AURDEDRAFT_174084 [Auricularia subglabra TFB-10046 SS5]|nr:hypothetical protein AURDEDRAFT_174084 [Auricularia subglabra TFB-10046 SS5]
MIVLGGRLTPSAPSQALEGDPENSAPLDIQIQPESSAAQSTIPVQAQQPGRSVPKQRGKKTDSAVPTVLPSNTVTAKATHAPNATSASSEDEPLQRPRRPAAAVAKHRLQELAKKGVRHKEGLWLPRDQGSMSSFPLMIVYDFTSCTRRVRPLELIYRKELGRVQEAEPDDPDDEIDFELAPAQSTAISGLEGDEEQEAGGHDIIFSFQMGDDEQQEEPEREAEFSDNDSPASEEEFVTAGTRKGKKARTPVPNAASARPANVLISVPDYTKPKRPQKTITFVKAQNVDFSAARATIKKALGGDIDEDINIEYKMWRSDAIKRKFNSPEDWGGWLENIEKYEKKKKFLETIVVFCSSPTLEDKPIDKSTKGGTDSLGLSGTSKQLHAYKLLRDNFASKPCGKPSCRDRFCKVDLNGNHGLSMGEFQAWGDALAAGIDGTTVDTPPHNERFKRFHRDLLELGEREKPSAPPRDRKAKEKEVPASLPPAVTQFFDRFDRVIGGAPTLQLDRPVPQRIVSKIRGPKIADFLAQLQENEGNLRNYVKYAEEFAAHELCFIGELVGWTCDDFQARIKMQIGSAQMVQQAIADQMAELEAAHEHE